LQGQAVQNLALILNPSTLGELIIGLFFDSDISPIASLILQSVKKCKMWPKFGL